MIKFLFLLSFLFALELSAQSIDLYQEVLMPGGPNAGQVLDTSKIRGLVILNESNNILPEALNKSSVYIANFAHNGKYYIARIPVSGPTSVDFIYEKFTNMAGGHADLVYHFDEKTPVELVYEIKNANLKKVSKPIQLGSVVLTAEAVRAIGDTSSLADGGIKNAFAMAYRMTSIPERLIGPVVKEGRRTTVIDIPYDINQVRRSFFDTIENQNRIGMSENYNLIINNCITSAIRGLANGLTPEEERRVEKELLRTFKKISAISRNDLSEEEMRKLFEDYLKIIRANKSKIGVTPIIEKSYFLDWLSEKQKELVLSNNCKQLF